VKLDIYEFECSGTREKSRLRTWHQLNIPHNKDYGTMLINTFLETSRHGNLIIP
jgi:hypothetical protein